MESSALTSVVLHFRNGDTARHDDQPSIDFERHIVTLAADEIPFGDLKAIFFLRGAPEAVVDEASAKGSILSVEFADGEIIRGKASAYNPVASGFFLSPLEPSKSDRIFVVSSAVVSIEVEKL